MIEIVQRIFLPTSTNWNYSLFESMEKFSYVLNLLIQIIKMELKISNYGKFESSVQMLKFHLWQKLLENKTWPY